MAVIDEQDWQRHIVGDVQIHRLGGDGRGFCVGQYRYLSAGLQDSVFYGRQVAVTLAAQLLEELVYSKTVARHILLEYLAIPDNHRRMAADQGAKADGFQAEEAQQHGQTQQRDNREQPVDQRDAKILHGHGCQVGNDQCQHQLAGLQLTDLPFAHQPQAGHQNEIEYHRAEKRGGHSPTSFPTEYLRKGPEISGHTPTKRQLGRIFKVERSEADLSTCFICRHQKSPAIFKMSSSSSS